MSLAILHDSQCAFPGDIRPLLRTNLRQVADSTREQRHTNDWLLREVVEVFLKKIRQLDADRAWAAYAILAEKLGYSPDEAAQRAGEMAGGRSPTTATLARHYTGRSSNEFKFVPAELIAAQILPHLRLSPLDISGARLYSLQESSGVELNAVAECYLFGSGNMRDFRRELGGKHCRQCNDYFYPGELICHECGAVDWMPPIHNTMIALIVFALAFWVFPSLFWGGLIVSGLFAIRALQRWKIIYDYYYKPIF